MSYQRSQRSRADSRATSPRAVTQVSHKSEILIDKSNYTEVTIETKDEDVPYIALYKPNFNKQKRRIQAASKIVYAFENASKLRKMLSLEPRQKLLTLRTLYLGAKIQKMMLRKNEKAFHSLIVNKIKRNGPITGAKMIWKIQNSLLQRNIQSSMSQLRRNRLTLLIKELSNENQQAKELTSLRAELFKFNEESYTTQLILASKKIQNISSYQSILPTIQENKYSDILKEEMKRFQQIRFSSSPRKKDLLDNQTVISVTSNIISAFQKTVSDYDNYCQELQKELASYKDVEGINELNQVIREKEKALRDIENYIVQNSKMDIELKKFTAENRFMVERVSSTLVAHEKKLQSKLKTLGETPSKIASSRIYLSGVMKTLIQKIGDVQSSQKNTEEEKMEQERSFNKELKDSRASIDSLQKEVNQEKSKIRLIVEKREMKRDLEDLKRKWREDQQGKTLVQFLLNQHQTIEQLQRKYKYITDQQREFSDDLKFIKNYLESGLQNVEAIQPSPKINRNFKEGLNQIADLMKQIFQLAYQRSRQNKESSEKEPIYQSKVEQIKTFHPQAPPSQAAFSVSEQMTSEQLFSHLKSSEKEFQKYSQQSKLTIIKKIDEETSTLIKELKRNKQELERQISERRSSEGVNADLRNERLNIEEIITMINQSESTISALNTQNADLSSKLEQITKHHQDHLESLQLQLAENNRLIRELANNKSPVKQSSKQLNLGPLMEKNEELLTKLIQLQKEIVRWKEENTAQQQRIRQLQGEILRKSRERFESTIKTESIVSTLDKQRIQNSIQNEKTLQEIRQKFQSLERYFQDQRDLIHRQDQNSQNRIQQLIEQLRQSEKNVTDLSSKNNQLSSINSELSSRLEQTKKEYQSQVSSFKVEQTEVTTKRFHLQQQLDNLKSHYEETYRQQINQLKKYKEESFTLRSKIKELESEGSLKKEDFQRIENRLRQTQNQLANEREKVSSLQIELTNVEKELSRSHTQTDRLAIEAREQIRKITLVIRSLEEELDKKTKQNEILQGEWNQKERTITNLEIEKNNLHNELRVALDACSSLELKNEDISAELTHLKAEFYSIQMELQSGRKSSVQSNERLTTLQNEIREKEQTISNILSRSKATSDNLNQQLYDAREDLLKQQTKFQEQLSLKNTLISKLENKILQFQSSQRNVEQRCLVLEQTIQKQKNQLGSDKKDREIELLHQQIASLQQFLGDVSKAYKELQLKYHEEKHRFGRFYDNAQQQRSMEEIDRAIHSLQDSSELSQEVKSLILNNEQLQISLEELEEEKRKLLERVETQPEREYVVELLFNILLGAKHLSPQSPKGNLLWNELIQINQKCSEVGELFTELEKFCLKLLTLSSE